MPAQAAQGRHLAALTYSTLASIHLQIAAVHPGIESGLFRSLSQSQMPLQVDQVAQKCGASPEYSDLYFATLRQIGSSQKQTMGSSQQIERLTLWQVRWPKPSFAMRVFDNCSPAIQEFPGFFAETHYQEFTSNTNTPFQKAFLADLTCFAWLAQHPERFNHVQHVMTALESADWTVRFSQFENEACAIIQPPQESRRPFLVDDLPQAVDQLPKIDGVETMAHDIFQTQVVRGKSYIYTQHNCPSILPSSADMKINPQGAKFYYLCRILHDYPDAQGIKILKNLRAVMAHDSQILIDEMVLPGTNVPWQATLADLSLMVSMGGKGALKGAAGNAC
ncbi:hypothetical protein BDV39DRAFT_203744 [Aspergillus sergii]|uniref:O-methyltransferase C-terminal domain-containing protein n=1 Tax=Aspergillus sergii TaxID=1034303 RepID=A0A5N6X941_9EURO|nr:hypothetical protein BDV39DRAFT_203744 [Aspergillus sergii]